jgi:effector-binding domain-containing protein
MSSEQITIGRFSQITRLTQKALRLYDQKGLLVPIIKDPMTGYRYYSVRQIEIGIKIKFLASLGFSLKEVEDLLKAAEEGAQEVININFSKRLSDVQQNIQQLEKIEAILLGRSSIEGLFMSTTEPTVKEVSQTRVISKRENANLENIGILVGKSIGELMGQIFNPKNQGQASISGPPMVLWLDQSFKETDINMEIAVPITGRITIDPEFELKNLPGGNVVFAIYKGSYDAIGEAYTKILDFATKKGYKQCAPMRELYLTNPNERSPKENMTEIQLPIE